MKNMLNELIHIVLSKECLISRCRINNPYNIDFVTKDQVSMPPAYCAKLCRANKKGQRVFYGTISDESVKNTKSKSYNRITALYEVSDFVKDINSEGIEVVTCSYWLLKRDLKLVALPLFDNYKNPTKLMLDINKKWKEANQEVADKMREMSKTFSQSVVDLTEKEKNAIYEKTASFVDELFKHKDIDGIIYPSVNLDGDGLCLALKEDVAIESIKLVDVIVLNLFKKGAEAKYIIRKECHVEDENMVFSFKRHQQGDINIMKQLKDEFGVDYINK